jgi:hypothetical protein
VQIDVNGTRLWFDVDWSIVVEFVATAAAGPAFEK